MLTEENKDLFRNYFKRSADYYLEQMESAENGKQYTFNAAGFFLGVFWMMHRKMYLQGLAVIAIMAAEGYIWGTIAEAINLSYDTYETVNKIKMLVFGIIIGFISNRLYISQSKKAVQKILDEHTDPEEINKMISKKGGVNWIAPIILFGIVLLALLAGA